MSRRKFFFAILLLCGINFRLAPGLVRTDGFFFCLGSDVGEADYFFSRLLGSPGLMTSGWTRAFGNQEWILLLLEFTCLSPADALEPHTLFSDRFWLSTTFRSSWSINSCLDTAVGTDWCANRRYGSGRPLTRRH